MTLLVPNLNSHKIKTEVNIDEITGTTEVTRTLGTRRTKCHKTVR